MFISKRKREPAHYMLTIKSFSLLSEAKTYKIESDVFEANGHKWSTFELSFCYRNEVNVTPYDLFVSIPYRRLDLYPNGKDEKNESRYISLYLVICDTGSYAKEWEVCVDVCFSVYDHLHHHYVTFQDVNGHTARFHKKNMIWGFDNLISLESFMDSKNGYLVNDSCVFGAEVIAFPQFTQVDRCLLTTKIPPSMNNHTWTINNFSAITEERLVSDVFKVGKVKWELLLYPKGVKSGEGTHLSIYLCVHDATSLPDGWKVYAKYKFRVKSHGIGTKSDKEKEADKWFYKSISAWGYGSFMLLSRLRDSENDFLLNDNLTIEVEISVMGTLTHFI